jgi:hypothetical protein
MSLTDVRAALVDKMPREVDGQVIQVVGDEDLPNTVPSANCPMRLVTLLDGAQGVTFKTLTLDGLKRVTYQLNDLLLLRPMGQGEGPADAARLLHGYIMAYGEAATANIKLTATARLNPTVKLEPGVYEYPRESGQRFIGCLATLQAEEVL